MCIAWAGGFHLIDSAGAFREICLCLEIRITATCRSRIHATGEVRAQLDKGAMRSQPDTLDEPLAYLRPA